MGRVDASLIPGINQGQFMTPAGVRTVKDYTDAFLYDSEIMPTIITAGQEFRFFVSNTFQTTGAVKTQGLHYNTPTWQSMPKDWEASILQVGFELPAGTPSDDLFALANGGYMQLITGSQKSEVDGLLRHFPPGFGIGGSIAADGNAVPVEVSALSIGIPSAGAVGRRQYSIYLGELLTFEVSVRFPAAITLRATPIKLLMCLLQVLRKRPVR